MKTDPLQAAADATAGYLLELARKGTTVITRDELEAFFRSEGIAESPNAVAFVLVGRELLRAHDRPVQQLPRTRGTWGGNATAAFFHVGWVDNEPDTWTILPAVLVTPEPKAASTKADDVAVIIGQILATVDDVNRQAIEIARDDTRTYIERGRALLNLDARFLEMKMTDVKRILGCSSVRNWWPDEVKEARKKWTAIQRGSM